MDVVLTSIPGELPAGFDQLRAEANAEGYRFLERLAADWEAGLMRFTADGEVLLAAHAAGDLAAIGGLTRDPVLPTMLRMRRFYVRAVFRRTGVGTKLAHALLDRAAHYARPVTVNAAAGSELFWESLGFVADPRDGHSHVLIRGDGSAQA